MNARHAAALGALLAALAAGGFFLLGSGRYPARGRFPSTTIDEALKVRDRLRPIFTGKRPAAALTELLAALPAERLLSIRVARADAAGVAGGFELELTRVGAVHLLDPTPLPLEPEVALARVTVASGEAGKLRTARADGLTLAEAEGLLKGPLAPVATGVAGTTSKVALELAPAKSGVEAVQVTVSTATKDGLEWIEAIFVP